jgi:hypothetical protein
MIAELVLISTVSWQVTAYRSVPRQTDSTPFNTSTGARTNSAICAISQDELGKQIHYGDYLFVEIRSNPELSRYCWCQDTMNGRVKHAVDLWVKTQAEEQKIGVRLGLIYKLPAPGDLMQVNTSTKRKVPTELIPRVVRTYGDLLLRNPNANEILTWNIAAELIWLEELAETQLLLKRLINIFKSS